MIVLNEIESFSSGLKSSISNFVSNGGSLIVIPSKQEETKDLNALLTSIGAGKLGGINTDSSRVNYINLESAIYTNVFTRTSDKINLPNIYKHFRWSKSPNVSYEYLLKSVNQDPILTKNNFNKGQVYVFTTSLQPEFTNFKIHSLFLPSLFQIAFQSAVQYQPYYEIGLNNLISVHTKYNLKEDLFHIYQKEKNVDLIPEIIPSQNGVTLNTHENIIGAGIYLITIHDSIVAKVAYNYSRLESNPETYSVLELNQLLHRLQLSNIKVLESNIYNFTENFTQSESGIELWRYFILLALIFLAIEVVLIRYFKPSVL
jgi:hypothetical protein